MTSLSTASPEEIARFSAIADAWWDEEGKFKPLHRFNPIRIEFLKNSLARHFGRNLEQERPFAGLSLLDVGCGGGLIAEPMARLGFEVTAIDASAKNIGVASLHAEQGGLAINYLNTRPEELVGQYDVVLILEVVEHVADLNLFMQAVAALLKPGGALMGATVARTLKSYALAIVGAEYVLQWLPKGTHDWNKFLNPAEFVDALRKVGVQTKSLQGIAYNLLKDEWYNSHDLDVNYLLWGKKNE